ncbi:MAG TPA: FAD-binding protein [Candidatus Aveggerthella stercoripullorum]|uniref:L-aspartate oxidase n=1 Tax=Candidatus Aveggerthella stercoripullorum TaxID=2840688 RepID=A0A9D0ZYI9_9ACTN|nr:FAD-binding protein [Candidatus Aveggerthella stercoripullorum]
MKSPLARCADPKEHAHYCDVLVVGSGIAGLSAALEAAGAEARVTVASLGPLCSGSSFFPGTWGLGMIGPVDESDEKSLEQAIEDVGCGMAEPTLVRTLVHGIQPALTHLESLGCALKHPARSGEREYIPCFDRKARLWRGILREPSERALKHALEAAHVRVLEQCELLDLADAGQGAVLFDHASRKAFFLACGAVVLACGGFGGLFAHRLTGADAVGSVHAIALAHGARLVNMEFMQVMPGLVSPCKDIVFNEKAFRFMGFEHSDAARSLTSRPDAGALLDERSTYGPFTSRLKARAVDAAIGSAGAQGLGMRYRAHGSLDNMPEFVRTYYEWLEKEHGVRPQDWMHIAPYAHAANGGILIDENAWTGVPGLFACGECTGGMHGADRIGGLSSANGIVFGGIAGRNAAHWALERLQGKIGRAEGGCGMAEDAAHAMLSPNALDTSHNALPCQAEVSAHRMPPSLGKSNTTLPSLDCLSGHQSCVANPRKVGELRAILQQTLSEHCMVVRTEEGLSAAEAMLCQLERELDCSKERHGRFGDAHGNAPSCLQGPFSLDEIDSQRADSLRLRLQLMTARCLVAAMRARRESRGSHYRADFPSQNAAFDRPFAISWDSSQNEPVCTHL